MDFITKWLLCFYFVNDTARRISNKENIEEIKIVYVCCFVRVVGVFRVFMQSDSRKCSIILTINML